MKEDFRSYVQGNVIPVYSRMGVPSFLEVQEMQRLRAEGRLKSVACQACHEIFLVSFAEPPPESQWEYGDPPFHDSGPGNPCVGNTMIAHPEYEFPIWEVEMPTGLLREILGIAKRRVV